MEVTMMGGFLLRIQISRTAMVLIFLYAVIYMYHVEDVALMTLVNDALRGMWDIMKLQCQYCSVCVFEWMERHYCTVFESFVKAREYACCAAEFMQRFWNESAFL